MTAPGGQRNVPDGGNTGVTALSIVSVKDKPPIERFSGGCYLALGEGAYRQASRRQDVGGSPNRRMDATLRAVGCQLATSVEPVQPEDPIASAGVYPIRPKAIMLFATNYGLL